MSAFIRSRQPTRTVDVGTRPGLHGQVLISTGLAGVDRLLGGGLPLGTIMLIMEDSNSQQHINLLKCFMGEGVCCKHSLGWVTAQQLTPESTAAFIPDQARSSSHSQASTSQQQPSSSSSSTSGPSAAGTIAADDGLRIAWQYRKYIQRADAAPVGPQQQDRSRTVSSQGQSGSAKSTSSSSSSAAKNVAAGVGREWCRQYDLSKGMTPVQLQGSKFETYCCQMQQGCAINAAGAAAAAFIKRFQPAGPIPIPSRDPASVGRLVVQSLGNAAWWPSSSSSGDSSSSSSWSNLESAMLTVVAELRLQIQDATCAAVITCPAGMYSESFQARLQHLADAVLCIQSLADNSDVYRMLPDPTSASALLDVRRLPHLGLLRQRYTEDRLYLIRHKRRSISVGVLDLLPLEAAEQSQGAAAADGKAVGKEVPAVAKICGSGPAGGKTLDF